VIPQCPEQGCCRIKVHCVLLSVDAQCGHCDLLGLVLIQISFCLPIGRRRRRVPVTAKIALVIAGTIGEVPGSPTPVGAASLSTMLTWISGVSLMRGMCLGYACNNLQKQINCYRMLIPPYLHYNQNHRYC